VGDETGSRLRQVDYTSDEACQITTSRASTDSYTSRDNDDDDDDRQLRTFGDSNSIHR
jgi:hypothetical protein